MTAGNQTAELDWTDGCVPVSTRFGDPYFSLGGGLAETRHVFLAGNGLPGRFRPGFHIAELGFGTGLNMLASLLAWRGSGQSGPLRFTSFEAYPMAPADIARALSAFPEVAEMAAGFLDQWSAGLRQIRLPGLAADIVIGEAAATLGPWPGRADAWFLDGFSPAKNPGLWTDALMAQVAAHSGAGGTFATYTAAGVVRRALAGAGFAVERRPGFGHKRHMTTGILSA
jgi:tRNA U34 5-methylaminomethyl-2-thiouridine-forming methyltransferase MnmC